MLNIYLMRHFEVDFKWKKKYSSEEFKTACEDYDTSGIINQNVKFDKNSIQQIFISDLKRSYLTYKGLEIDVHATKTDLINEVPMAPFINTKLKLPMSVWMTFGRIQWFFNNKRQPETKKDTYQKIENLLSQLEENKDNVLIVGHGFYFSQLKRVLKKKNYKGSGKSHYKNGEVIKFTK